MAHTLGQLCPPSDGAVPLHGIGSTLFLFSSAHVIFPCGSPLRGGAHAEGAAQRARIQALSWCWYVCVNVCACVRA